MELKITRGIENGHTIYLVGKLVFATHAEAKEFIDLVSRLFLRRRDLVEAAECWAGRQQQEHDSGNPVLHDVVTSLLYLSFVLASVGAVGKMHLAMIRQITKRLEKLEKAVQTNEEAKMMTKGDVAVIMGDEWAKVNLGTSLKAKLKTAQEPAPPDWVEMAREEAAKKKKRKSGGHSMGM